MNVLVVHTSARSDAHSRRLTERLLAPLRGDGATITVRDLADGIGLLDELQVHARGLPADALTPEQAASLAEGETLIAELEAADVVVISSPIYNFHLPASFKAWVDLIAWPRRTFHYTADGPQGLLADRPVVMIVTSGGTRLGSPVDFVSGWLRFVLAFVGLNDVRLVDATGLGVGGAERLSEAEALVDAAAEALLAASAA